MYNDLRKFSNILWVMGVIFALFAFRILIHLYQGTLFFVNQDQPFLLVSICCYVLAIPAISFLIAFYLRKHCNELESIAINSADKDKTNFEKLNRDIQRINENVDRLKEQLNKDN